MLTLPSTPSPTYEDQKLDWMLHPKLCTLQFQHLKRIFCHLIIPETCCQVEVLTKQQSLMSDLKQEFFRENWVTWNKNFPVKIEWTETRFFPWRKRLNNSYKPRLQLCIALISSSPSSSSSLKEFTTLHPHHTIWKVKVLSKNSILTKPQHFHEFFAKIFFDNFSREIKVVNS